MLLFVFHDAKLKTTCSKSWYRFIFSDGFLKIGNDSSTTHWHLFGVLSIIFIPLKHDIGVLPWQFLFMPINNYNSIWDTLWERRT